MLLYVSSVVKRCQEYDLIFEGNLETRKEPSASKATTDIAHSQLTVFFRRTRINAQT